MTPVEERLRRRIALYGPISVADYMAACLTDPDGYYATAQPFGEAGDFVTAPEISQMFGELIGAWLLERWYADGTPAPVDLVELGPGRGTLMADVLRVMGRDSRWIGASRVVLIEHSERLRAVQRSRLSPCHPRLSFSERFDGARPFYLVANEFFDALPIRQFVRRDGGWFERTIGVVSEQLTFGLSPFASPFPAGDAPSGAVKEVRPAADALADEMGSAICAHGVGAALIVDYGYHGAIGGETLQAVRRHASVSVLEDPGQADLSAHVDFTALTAAALRSGAAAHGPVPQGKFLFALGLGERAGRLMAAADGAQRQEIESAVKRLAGDGDGEMGALFKVFALTPPAAPPPAGF